MCSGWRAFGVGTRAGRVGSRGPQAQKPEPRVWGSGFVPERTNLGDSTLSLSTPAQTFSDI
jgi:hypothetical protein